MGKKISEKDIGFVPDQFLIHMKNIKTCREILSSLKEKYKVFTQQILTFILALDRSREKALEPTRPITTIFQVEHYQKNVSENSTDKRVLKEFLDIIDGLEQLHRRLVEITKTPNDKLETIYFKWSKITSKKMNIMFLRSKKPNPLLNNLNYTQSQVHFGGIVSVIPAVLELAKQGIEEIMESRAYAPATSTTQETINKIIETKIAKIGAEMEKFPTPKFKNAMRGV